MPDLVVRMLGGDFSAVTSGLGKIQAQSKANGSAIGAVGKIAGVLGTSLVGLFVTGMVGAVGAAEAAQVSQAALSTAIKATGQSVRATAGALSAAEASGRKLGFSNNDSRAALTKLEFASKDTKTAVTDLGVAENLARARHIDLGTASQMLAMAMAGSTRVLRQLGIVFSASTTHVDALKREYAHLGEKIPAAALAQAQILDKEDASKQIIALVSAKVTGQADAYRRTAAGGMAAFHAQIGDLNESLGQMVMPAVMQATSLIAALAEWMSEHATLTKVIVASLGALATGLLILAAVTWAVDVVMDANPIGLIALAILAVALSAIYTYQHFHEFRDALTNAFVPIRHAVAAVVHFVTVTIPSGFTAIIGWLRAHWPVIATVISGPFAPLVVLATNAFGARKALQGFAQDGMNAFSKTVFDFIATLPGLVIKAIGKVISSFLGGGGGGGARVNLNAAIRFAKAQMGKPYVWGGAHGSVGVYPGYDCSGFATQAASRINGYTGGITTTWYAYPASTPAKGNEPVVFGFMDFQPHNGLEEPGHMGIRLAGTWYQFGNPGHTGGSFPSLRVPAGLKGKDYAMGGVFMAPTPGRVGEAGPEAIIPLERFGRVGGRPPISITIDRFFGSERELAARIEDVLCSPAVVRG